MRRLVIVLLAVIALGVSAEAQAKRGRNRCGCDGQVRPVRSRMSLIHRSGRLGESLRARGCSTGECQ